MIELKQTQFPFGNNNIVNPDKPSSILPFLIISSIIIGGIISYLHYSKIKDETK